MGKAKLKITIKCLADTAIEKYCVGGDEAISEVNRLKEVAEDLAVWWGHEELEGMFENLLKGKVPV